MNADVGCQCCIPEQAYLLWCSRLILRRGWQLFNHDFSRVDCGPVAMLFFLWTTGTIGHHVGVADPVSRPGSFPPTASDHLSPQHLGGAQANLFLDIDLTPIHPCVHDRSVGCASGALTFLPAEDFGQEPGWAGPSARLGVLGIGTRRLVVLANHFAIVACTTDASMEIHGIGSLSSGLGGQVRRGRRLCGRGGCRREDWWFRKGQRGRRGGRKGRMVHDAVLVTRVIRGI